jgi:F-type H+-transporting ATPase subunit a
MRLLRTPTTEAPAPKKLALRLAAGVSFLALALALGLGPARAQTPHGQAGSAQEQRGAVIQMQAPPAGTRGPNEGTEIRGSTGPAGEATHPPAGAEQTPGGETGAAGEQGAEGAGGHAAEGAGEHGAEAGGEHGEKGGDEFHIEVGTWITGLLKQWWFSGPSTVSVDGVVGATKQELEGKQIELEYEDEESHLHPKPHVKIRPVVTHVGDMTSIPEGIHTAKATVDGREVTLIHPVATFAYAGMFPEGLVISIITALFLALVAFFLTRNLHRVPSKLQMMTEMIFTGLDGFVRDLIGPPYKRYLPLIGTSFLYILFMNLAGLIPGWKSPTSNINVTGALALTIIAYVQYEGLRVNGLKGYLMHFVGEPWWLFWLNIPIHIIGELARVMSLAIRLFGNIFGEDVVIVILLLLAVKFTGGFVPIHAPMYFLGVFTSLVQALVFSLLASIYIAMMVTHEEGDHGGHGHDHSHDEHHETGIPERAPAPAV